MSDVARLAAALLNSGLRAFRVVPEREREPLLSALDVFLANPGPVTFLRTSRVLHDATRAHHLARLGTAGMERAVQRGLEALSLVPEMDPGVVQRLSALPADPRAGRRLEALAALIISHQELAARAEAASNKQRRQLEKMGRRSTPPRSSATRSTPPKSIPPRKKSTVEVGH